MPQNNNWPPAFPGPVNAFEHDGGMALRDYFAAHISPGDVYGYGPGETIPDRIMEALNNGEPHPPAGTHPIDNVKYWAAALAKWKYLMADQMLEARK